MSRVRHREHVLALSIDTRGISFALFTAPLSPIDWGAKDVRGRKKNALCLDAARRLIERMQPDIVVLEEHPRNRRPARIHRLHHLIRSHALGQSIEVYSVTRRDVRKCFRSVGAVTRYEIAQAIAAQIPAFAHRMPPVRRLWMNEPSVMALFDAAAYAMTYYGRQHSNRRERESGS